MSKMIELTDLNSDNFLEMLKNEDIIMYENIQGCKLFFSFNGEEVILKQKSINNDPINLIDISLQKFYNKALYHLINLDSRIKNLCQGKWFSCLYFPDEKPAHIRYDILPTNHLILNSVIKNNVFSFNYDEIMEYSELLNIQPLPILFYGKLSDKQLELLKYFLHTKKEDLEFIFGEGNDNFASFFYKILNPSQKNSILMKQGTYQEMLDKIIIKLKNESEISLSILNPLYSKEDSKSNNFLDIYSIIITDFLEYLQYINLESRYLKGKKYDEIYINIISDLFNQFFTERTNRIKKFQFEVPPFFYDDKFRLNIDMINNNQTKMLISSSEKIEFIFKVILQSFRFKKDKPFGIINKNILKLFNSYIDKINNMIDKSLRIDREEELIKHDLLDFGKFFKIKYPEPDAEGKFYPDLHNDLTNNINPNIKKKK